ncbi:type II toxin-antitoxin system VapC family toxin [Methylobacterium durans]|uniref:type II toxin-antitoxin system VapC family toxin n=1 Tax=Methylobacterium durans TaxID=2202825 RepID=UPI002AFF4D0A|nr:type II toxin-antitoxin system VapC family toxin [Methylobacterium durans]MEA1834696.1 type II toxin-antitoxin system VapC family toxin [Methylobacterium durans]
MILVDTSVWVDHLRAVDPELARHLDAGRVLVHPFVLGEIALGSLRRRVEVLDALAALPNAAVVPESEVLRFIRDRALFGSGIGYVDAHLLASALAMPSARLWTRDRRLLKTAEGLGVALPERPGPSPTAEAGG